MTIPRTDTGMPLYLKEIPAPPTPGERKLQKREADIRSLRTG